MLTVNIIYIISAKHIYNNVKHIVAIVKHIVVIGEKMP